VLLKVLIVHSDLHVLAGNVRAMLMFADVLKYLGVDFLFLYTDIRPEFDYFWKPEDLKRYHAVKYVDFKPLRVVDVIDRRTGKKVSETTIMGDFQRIPHRYLVQQIYDYTQYGGFTHLFTDELYLMWFYDFVPGVLYVHYPDRPSGPGPKAKVWVNSKYIQSLTWDVWKVRSVVINPPLHLDLYKPNRSFHQRDYDVVFFGQFYKVKGFDLARMFAEEGLRVAVVGAKVHSYVPKVSKNVDVFPNATVREYVDILSRSKVYVHARPGEHFGITITEAMASGCPAIVHRSGGQWTDVVDQGRYGLGWSSTEELKSKVLKLVKDESLWFKYHRLSIDGVKRFEFKTIAGRIKNLLNTYI